MTSYERVEDPSNAAIAGTASPSPPPPKWQMLYHQIKDNFKTLEGAPRELYINFLLKFFESYGYFALSQILVIYLHQEFGVSDVAAGTIYGMWGLCITFWGLVASYINDKMGVRNSLLVGFSISAVSSVLVATATSVEIIYLVLFVIMPVGTSMGIPMLTVGIKRYTTTINRGFAFGLYYSVMNVAAFMSGPVVDGLNIGLQSGVRFLGMTWSGNRLVILTTTCTYLSSLAVTYFFLREIRVADHSPSAGGGADRARHHQRVGEEVHSPFPPSTPSSQQFVIEEGDEEEEEEEGAAASARGDIGLKSTSMSRKEKTKVRVEGEEEKVKEKEKEKGKEFGRSGEVELTDFVANRPRVTMISAILPGADPDEDLDAGTQVFVCNPVSCSMVAVGADSQARADTTESLARGWGDCPSSTNVEGQWGLEEVDPCADMDEEIDFTDAAQAADAANERVAAEAAAHEGGEQVTGAIEEYVPLQTSFLFTCSELVYSATFWRFVVLTLFLINLRAIFRHLDATLPTYLIRCFGSNYPKGVIYSINPFMIMWLTPVVAAMTTKFAHYDMIKYGGYVSAASPFFLVIATQTWAVVMFVVTLSLGEAIWSPRTYDYTMSIAPEGREASFSALAAAPLFAAKVPVGLLSGYLVSTYIAEGDEHPDGQTLWLIVGILTMSSPILITVFERCIREPLPSDPRLLQLQLGPGGQFREEGSEHCSASATTTTGKSVRSRREGEDLETGSGTPTGSESESGHNSSDHNQHSPGARVEWGGGSGGNGPESLLNIAAPPSTAASAHAATRRVVAAARSKIRSKLHKARGYASVGDTDATPPAMPLPRRSQRQRRREKEKRDKVEEAGSNDDDKGGSGGGDYASDEGDQVVHL